MSIELVWVDFNQPEQAAQLVALLDAYAREEAGGGEPDPGQGFVPDVAIVVGRHHVDGEHQEHRHRGQEMGCRRL